MNAGTCWAKNTIGPSGRGVEKPRKATLTFNHNTLTAKAFKDVATNYNFKLILKQAYYDFRKQPSFL
jgi:phosphorylcholine metabolism protein LicD